jgi:hypothetical protein
VKVLEESLIRHEDPAHKPPATETQSLFIEQEQAEFRWLSKYFHSSTEPSLRLTKSLDAAPYNRERSIDRQHSYHKYEKGS